MFDQKAGCRTCKIISALLGKNLFMGLFVHGRSRITFRQVEPCLSGLKLRIVGGLSERGWTDNDIDVIGDRTHVSTFSARLRAVGILNPIHWCGTYEVHSCVSCAYFGIKLVLTGKGY